MRGNLRSVIVAASIAFTPFGLANAQGSSGAQGNGMVSTDGSLRTRTEAAKEAMVTVSRAIKNAKDCDADAAKASSPEKGAKAQAKAQKYYQDAITKLIDIVGWDPKMAEAWNDLAYASLKLGHYQEAADSYDKALALDPHSTQAIEQRGEAYLGLNQTEDAKAAYTSLSQSAPPLADELMRAMRQWTDARRKDAQGLSLEDVDSFAKWMDERGKST